MGFDVYVGGLTRDGWRDGLDRLFGRVVDWVGHKLNRSQRSEADRAARGVLAVSVLALLAAALGLLISYVSRGAPLLWMLELVSLVMLLRVRRPRDQLGALAAALRRGDRPGAEAALAPLTDRNLSHADTHELARLGIAGLGRAFARTFLAPLLFYWLFGLAGLFVERVARVLADRYAPADAYGRGPRTFAAILAWAPRWLAAALLALAAWPRPSGDPRAAWRVAVQATAPDAPVAAIAGALGLSLGGPRRYAARTVSELWIGNGRARATEQDLDAATALYSAAALAVALLIAATAILSWIA